ncbi:MAG: TerC family protein [Polyangiaceae bacterium]|nr:TerC family protein [Polyangiaceae bacterium]
MEIVLGIDNIVFISILTSRLPAEQRTRIARVGLSLAMGMRIALLFAIGWIMSLKAELFSVFGKGFSGRDLVLLVGGLFLVAKATTEIHSKVEDHEEHGKTTKASAAVGLVLVQILALDIVFSLDSVITAVGMVPPEQMWIMISAVIVSVVVMLAFAGRLSDFVMAHPSVKILALAFLLLIGVMLVADGLGQKIPKGYIYFAMAFSLGVELLNMRFRAKKKAEKDEPAPVSADGAPGAVTDP